MATKPRKASPTGARVLSYPMVVRLRLLAVGTIGVAAAFAIPGHYVQPTRMLFAWDIAVAAYMLSILRVMTSSTSDHMRRRASIQDQSRWVILAIIVAGVGFSFAALVSVQSHLKSDGEANAALYLALTVATIFLSWVVLHTVFALHYAHEYYGPATDEDDEDGLIGGLDFPGEKQPDYFDFMYFAFVVGMTCQVSDVQVPGRGLRRMTLIHGIVAFFFNTIILALTINIIAGVI